MSSSWGLDSSEWKEGEETGVVKQGMDYEEQCEVTELDSPAKSQVFREGHDQIHTSQKCGFHGQVVLRTTEEIEGQGRSCAKGLHKLRVPRNDTERQDLTRVGLREFAL